MRLLGEYSTAYASNQFRAVRLFLRWLAVEEDRPDPVTGLRAPTVSPGWCRCSPAKNFPRCGGRARAASFAERRDAAIIEVLVATGIRLSELAGIRYDPDDPARGDLNLYGREIRVRGKGGRPRIVRIGYRGRPEPGPVPAGPRQASAGGPAAAVAGGERAGAADPERDLPDRRPPRASRPGWRCTRTGSGTISATPGWTAAAPRAT